MNESAAYWFSEERSENLSCCWLHHIASIGYLTPYARETLRDTIRERGQETVLDAALVALAFTAEPPFAPSLFFSLLFDFCASPRRAVIDYLYELTQEIYEEELKEREDSLECREEIRAIIEDNYLTGDAASAEWLAGSPCCVPDLEGYFEYWKNPD